jgi:LacI family transcriptional regulator
MRKVILLMPAAREADRGIRRGIIEYSQLHGPWTFYEEPPLYLGWLNSRQRLTHMQNWGADGVIALQNRVGEVRALHLPTVSINGNRDVSRVRCQVVCNDEAIGHIAAEELRSLGLRRFAYCGLGGLPFSDHRRYSFVQALSDAGLNADVYAPTVRHSAKSWYTEEKSLARWLASLEKPLGLLACNDDRARMVAEVCRLSGIRVPDDIAILGIDNDEQVCRSASPPLSSLKLGTEKAGYAAAAALEQLMTAKNSAIQTITVEPMHIVRRQSTDLLSIDDPCMVRALRFIRQNSNRATSVLEVAAAAGLSRRALQDRFGQSLGCSPIQEIHRCRVEHIRQLLSDTDMTISEVAAASGFEIDAHIARFFSRQTGVTPKAYRRKLLRSR